jgi:hypothetical protein
MPKRKKLVPARRQINIRLSGIDYTTGSVAGLVVKRVTVQMNDIDVPPMLPGWEPHIEEHLHAECTRSRKTLRVYVETIAGGYIAARVGVLNASSFKGRQVALRFMGPSPERRRLQAEHDAGKELKHDTPWRSLVMGLADVFEASGNKVTAAKTPRKNPSPFVMFVWAVMKHAVPKELREHASSPDTMAAAITKALKAGRQKNVGLFLSTFGPP